MKSFYVAIQFYFVPVLAMVITYVVSYWFADMSDKEMKTLSCQSKSAAQAAAEAFGQWY